jgi:hypothetical protein
MKTSFIEGLLVQPMKARICRSCGVEFELEETEPHTVYCASCEYSERKEQELIAEWERAQWFCGGTDD